LTHIFFELKSLNSCIWKWQLLFPPCCLFARLVNFSKMHLCNSDFEIQIQFFLCYRVKNWVLHQLKFFRIMQSENLKKIGHATYFFSDYIIWNPPKNPFSVEKQFKLYNLDCISINFEFVCNMDNQFKDNINLSNSHPSILGHC